MAVFICDMKEQMLFTAREFIGVLKDPAWAPMAADEFNAAKADLMRYIDYGHIDADRADKPVIGYLAKRFEPVARVAAAISGLGRDKNGNMIDASVKITGYQVDVTLSRADKPAPRLLSIAYGVDSFDAPVTMSQRSRGGLQSPMALSAMMAVYGNYRLFGESIDLVRSMHFFANTSTAFKTEQIAAAVFEGTQQDYPLLRKGRNVVPLIPRKTR